MTGVIPCGPLNQHFHKNYVGDEKQYVEYELFEPGISARSPAKQSFACDGEGDEEHGEPEDGYIEADEHKRIGRLRGAHPEDGGCDKIDGAENAAGDEVDDKSCGGDRTGPGVLACCPEQEGAVYNDEARPENVQLKEDMGDDPHDDAGGGTGEKPCNNGMHRTSFADHRRIKLGGSKTRKTPWDVTRTLWGC